MHLHISNVPTHTIISPIALLFLITYKLRATFLALCEAFRILS